VCRSSSSHGGQAAPPAALGSGGALARHTQRVAATSEFSSAMLGGKSTSGCTGGGHTMPSTVSSSSKHKLPSTRRFARTFSSCAGDNDVDDVALRGGRAAGVDIAAFASSPEGGIGGA